MSLAVEVSRKVYNSQRRLVGNRLLGTAWFCLGLFVTCVALALLLQRVGLDARRGVLLLAALLVVVVLVLGWLGRTMASGSFFSMERAASAPLIGISGLPDWMSGAVLAALLALGGSGRLVLAAAISLGIVLQAALMAATIQRPGIVTLPGLFAWRTGAQRTGLIALVTVFLVLATLAAAEAMVAVSAAVSLTGIAIWPATLTIVALAALPALAGGWMTLVLINLTLAMVGLLALLVPSAAVAFLPASLLASDPLLAQVALDPLPLARTFSLGVDGSFDALLTLIVLATGLASLPVGLSRLALAPSGTAASQATGWIALGIFLTLASLPIVALSLEDPASAAASMVANRPLLGALGTFALLIAAYNALAATLFMASTSIVRALRRTQRKDPSERSMASIRLLTIALALLLALYLDRSGANPIESAGTFWLTGVCIAASGLFWPLVAAGWASRIPWLAYAAALVVGPLVVVLVFSGNGPLGDGIDLLQAAFVGQVLSAGALLVGRLGPRLFGRTPLDPRLGELRRPQGA